MTPVAKAAESIGWTVDDYINQVLADAKANGVDARWAVSVDRQMDRSIYRIQMPAHGWWVQMDHPDTLAALERLTPTVSGMTEVLQVLTAGSISGENRAVRTLLAEVIRQQVLDDGSEALGISFASKTLFGRCWAYWDRRFDAWLPPGSNDLRQLASENVGPDPDFVHVPPTTIFRYWAVTPDHSGVQRAVARCEMLTIEGVGLCAQKNRWRPGRTNQTHDRSVPWRSAPPGPRRVPP